MFVATLKDRHLDLNISQSALGHAALSFGLSTGGGLALLELLPDDPCSVLWAVKSAAAMTASTLPVSYVQPVLGHLIEVITLPPPSFSLLKTTCHRKGIAFQAA